MTTTFAHINILVADMDATVAFYRLLGLDVPDAVEWPPGSGAKHVEVHMPGNCYLAFDDHIMARIWNTRFDPARGAGNIVVGLLVTTPGDVDRICDTVKQAGFRIEQEPYDAFWGSRYAIVIDPDGNQVGVKSPPDDERAYEPQVRRCPRNETATRPESHPRIVWTPRRSQARRRHAPVRQTRADGRRGWTSVCTCR